MLPRKLVRQYNDTGMILMKFECEVESGRRNPSIRQIETMIAKPVLKEQLAGGLQLNFDPILYNMLRENERLCKLDITLPSVNQFLIKRKSWFLEFKDMVELMLEQYHQAIYSLAPDLKRLYGPHLNKIRACLEPGMAQINWTCHSWEEFTEKCINDVSIFKDLIDRANDIYVNRLEKLLESLMDTKLYSLPKTTPWPMEKFVEVIRTKCKAGSKELQKKSSMIEDAIEDLISLALEFKPKVDVMPDAKEEVVEEDDNDDPRKRRKKKIERVPSEEEVPLAPINILTVLDKNQIGRLSKGFAFQNFPPSGSEHSSQGPEEELQQEDLREARPSHEDNHQSPGQPLQGMCCTNCNCVISLLIKTPQAASGDESILSAECKSMEQYTAGEIIFVLETFLSFPKIEVNILLCLRQQQLFTSVITSLNTLSPCSSICVF